MRAAAFVLLASLLGVSAGPGTPAISIWPNPRQFSHGPANATVDFDRSFRFECSGAGCGPFMTAAFDRYTQSIFFAGLPASTPSTTLRSCRVNVEQIVPIALHMDESYSIRLTESECLISAKTQIGALRGVDSFSQLSLWLPHLPGTAGSPNGVYRLRGLPISVSDSPRFPWRGLLIDTSRHFLSVRAIIKILDGMAFNKLNVLHWHIVDDNSWPLVSTKFPLFSQRGAFSQRQIYTPEAVQRILAAAAARGIIVVPEFDMPAHASVWGAGYPDLVDSCADGQTLIDPTGPAYPAITQLLGEFGEAGMFSGKFVHFGGDEVQNYRCWDASPRVQAFKKENNFTTNLEVRNYFQTRIQKIALAAGDVPIFWEEVFNNNFDLLPEAVVNVWLSAAKLAAVVRKGLRGVHSFGYYLDQQVPPGGTHYLWLDTWQNFYLNDPVAGQNLTPAELARVLGGEASQWGEQADSSNVFVHIFPRAAAVAEKLWSPQAMTTSVADAAPRLEKQRCHLAQRNIPSGPIRPGNVYFNCEFVTDLDV